MKWNPPRGHAVPPRLVPEGGSNQVSECFILDVVSPVSSRLSANQVQQHRVFFCSLTCSLALEAAKYAQVEVV